MDRTPCRVMGDLASHEADLRDTVYEHFDEYQDDHVAAVVPYELVKPVQELLITLNQIEMIQASFGDPDKARVFDQLIPELKALRSACLSRWKDI